MFRWYLVHTKPRGEALAQCNLERQGYEVYFPRLVQPVRRRARWCGAVVALFPRYLFLHLQEGQQSLGPVRSTAGVASLVRFGSRYALVPDRVVADLRACADSDTGLHQLTRRSPFESGRAVRMAAGPLQGMEGVFEREIGSDRVVILLNLLGQEVPVRVDSGLVVPQFAL